MSTVRVEVGDGPREVTVTAMTRAQWSAWGDIPDEVARERALIRWCTDLDPDEVLDDWPAAAAARVVEECERVSAPSWEWAIDRVKRDPYLSLTLALCQEIGVPLSTFTAWPTRDQDLALARYVISNDRCPGCNAPTDAQRKPAGFDVDVVECLMCAQMDDVRSRIPDGKSSRTHLSVVPSKEVP